MCVRPMVADVQARNDVKHVWASLNMEDKIEWRLPKAVDAGSTYLGFGVTLTLTPSPTHVVGDLREPSGREKEKSQKRLSIED